MIDAPKKVTKERWLAAQEWEQSLWIKTQSLRARWAKNCIWRILSWFKIVDRLRGDDSNFWWAGQFANYAFLPPSFENAIELGCGPYTNLRIIAKSSACRHIVLSDPLLRTYSKFKLTIFADIPKHFFATLDDHPIEEIPFRSNYFDLVVMINVLDHVLDADLCLKTAIDLVRPGGILVFGQDLTNAEDQEFLKDDPGEIGHPVKMDHLWVEPRLLPFFEPVFHKVLSRNEGRGPQSHYGTFLFAGRKPVVEAR